jgi:hypothetical protein
MNLDVDGKYSLYFDSNNLGGVNFEKPILVMFNVNGAMQFLYTNTD